MPCEWLELFPVLSDDLFLDEVELEDLVDPVLDEEELDESSELDSEELEVLDGLSVRD